MHRVLPVLSGPRKHVLVCVVMTQSQEWEKAVHERIAAAIKNAREGRLTAQQLADETKRLGYPISRSQISNYEVGRKQGLDVTELLVIAAALGVPPLPLLFPGEPNDEVEMLPNQPAPIFFAKAWFSGDPWDPIRERVAELTEQLGQIDRAIAMTAEGTFSATVKAIHSGEQETK